MKPVRFLLLCTLCFSFVAGNSNARAAQKRKDADCLACHSNPSLTKQEDGKTVSLFIDQNQLKHSIHGKMLGCVDCHKDQNSPTHDKPPAKVACADCHAAAQQAYAHSMHAKPAGNAPAAATCVDCHNAHGSQPVGAVFPPPPLIRISQKDIAGISATDGITVLTPATNQYENCLRCHGNSIGKQIVTTYGYFPVRAVATSDPLNLISQFATTASSSHPVIRTASGVNQTSLLPFMLNVDGSQGKRTMGVGSQLLCTDCHNSDDNREFGGTGPNGPHGSKWTHILEHRYEFSQAPGPGQTINILYTTPDLSVNGPYGLCAKCHSLSTVLTAASWSEHFNHVSTYGFSCSTCHTAHGNPSITGSISGQRLVNFDLNVVAPVVTAGNVKLPVSYTYGPNTCVLVCHGATHNPDGTVSMVRVSKGPVLKK